MYSALPVREIAMMFQKGNRITIASKMNRQMLKTSKIREPIDCLIAFPPWDPAALIFEFLCFPAM